MMWILILIIAGQPERAFPEPFPTMTACNQVGADFQSAYTDMFHVKPNEVSYRCVPQS